MSTLALQIGFICFFKLWGLCERGVLINMGIRPYNYKLSSNRLIASEVVQYIDRNNSITSKFFTR